jgi:hypothetical protein
MLLNGCRNTSRRWSSTPAGGHLHFMKRYLKEKANTIGWLILSPFFFLTLAICVICAMLRGEREDAENAQRDSKGI